MTLHVTLSDKAAEQLASLATATSRTPEQVAAAVIEKELDDWNRLEETLAPVRAAFEASGMTEEELTDLLEAEKHAMRRERREVEASSAKQS
jgi:predicted transcriptional regulator